MTHSKFDELFRSKYPNGRTWMHNEFCRDQSRYIDKVAVEFQRGGKVYFYTGAYEDILRKVGVNVISRTRLFSLEDTLSRMVEANGKQDEFFGGTVDNSAEIARLTAEVDKYRRDYIIV